MASSQWWVGNFFINLSRGSGIKGFMEFKNENNILRPASEVYKTEIYAFAEENQIDFREDKSNEKTIILEIKWKSTHPKNSGDFPQFLEQFGESLSYLSSVNDFIKTKSKRHFKKF